MTNDNDALPRNARALADVIGLDALLRWVEAQGGTSRRVPVEPDDESELARILGRSAYRDLVRHYRGEIVEVPLLHTSRQRLFEAEIVRALESGAKVQDLVAQHRVARQSIARIARRVRERDAKERQMGLAL